MINNVELIKNDLNIYFSENEELKTFRIAFILYNQEEDEYRVLASDDGDNVILFNPYTKEKDYTNVPDWDFNFDDYLYSDLEEDYKIAYISDDAHYWVWKDIEQLYPYDINHKKGVQEYLKYCNLNDITREYLDKELRIDIPDIMKYFEYPKGFIEYKDNKVIMSRQTYADITEQSYIAFVLGYDLLNKEIIDSIYPECDISYDICNDLAKLFMESREYHNDKYSTYEMLQNWIDNNPYIIKQYIENSPVKLDNAELIDVGYRKEQPIALVLKNNEYIIGFNYQIKDNKIEWAYGKYYDNDIDKAKSDFQKVLSGGNLSRNDRSDR